MKIFRLNGWAVRPQALLLVIAAFSCGCLRLDDAGSGAATDDSQEVVQAERERVSKEFIETSDLAIDKYRPRWLAGEFDASCREARVKESVLGLTIAGYLFEKDPENQSKYERYIFSCLESRDWQVLTAGVTALRNINSKRAVDYLLANAGSDDDLVAMDALTVIDYKLVTSKGLPEDWRSYLRKEVEKMCDSNNTNDHMKDYCRGWRQYWQ